MSEDLKSRLYRLGSRSLPKILTLQDRNPHSPTYGCFDRKYWHLRVTDFPSGMAQEFVLPLALAHAHSFADNPFHGNETIREWIRAGISYAARSAHGDGSCDDYFPFEKASGATAFSFYAIVEALPLAGIDPEPFLPFLRRRARWLARHRESGRLANHEALIANSLFRFTRIAGEQEFSELARARLDRLLAWQSAEGWFYEYQGCDPGYLTLTLANMAEIDALHPELGLRAPIDRAVDFLHRLQPPDGWFGGEWTSRNTHNYFPHGLEMIGAWNRAALVINTRAVAALDPAPEYDDDAIIGHHSWSYLKAAELWREDRHGPEAQKRDETWPEAGIVIRRAGRFTLLAAMRKGGAFRFYDSGRLALSDTGVSLRIPARRSTRTLVSHLWNEAAEWTEGEEGLTVAGPLGPARSTRMTPLRNIVLRLFMLLVGRLYPDLARRILQRMLITGRPSSAFRFHRQLRLAATGLSVHDRVEGSGPVLEAGIGGAQTSIHTVMSRVYHPSQLQPWLDITAELRSGNPRIDLTRRFGGNRP